MAKSPRCLSLLLACALFCFFLHDASRTFVSSGMNRASPPQHQKQKVSIEAYGGSGGGGYGGGGSGQSSQFGSTLLLFGLIGGLMYVGWTTLEGAESRGWNAPTYHAPAAAPAPFQKDRATLKEEAIRQIMADGAARRNPEDVAVDRFRSLKAVPLVERQQPEIAQYDGSEIPGTFPSLQRNNLNNAGPGFTGLRNLLPERYGNSARPINSAF